MSQSWNEQFSNYKNCNIDSAFIEKELEFKRLISQKQIEGIIDIESYNKANYKTVSFTVRWAISKMRTGENLIEKNQNLKRWGEHKIKSKEIEM